MNGKSDLQRLTVLGLACVMAMLAGLFVSSVDVKWVVVGLIALVAVSFVIRDFRVGVVCLTLLLPWTSSPLLPQTYGFNLINFVMLASVVSLGIRHGFEKNGLVPLPSVVRWCYLLPILLGIVIAWPYLAQGAANYPSTIPGEPSTYAPANYLKSRIVKPLFFVLYAFLVGNAVARSKKAERFLAVYGLSAAISALVVIVAAVVGSGSVDDRSTYLEDFGLGPNSFGWLLAVAAGPLLFLAAGGGSRRARVGSGVAFALVSIGLMFTGSRGAAVAYIIVLLVWLIRRRRFSDLLVLIVLAGVLALAVPDKVWDRLTLGVDDAQATSTSNLDDPLTKGRVAAWSMLAPEVLNSPIWGQGVGSVAWNQATTAGRYGASLSHNMYLDILLDFGVLGFGAFLYLYYRYAKGLSNLSRSASLSPVLRDYFAGAFASFLGILGMALTNGMYMPLPEQAFWWFGLGMLFGHWPAAQDVRESAEQKASRLSGMNHRNLSPEFLGRSKQRDR